MILVTTLLALAAAPMPQQVQGVRIVPQGGVEAPEQPSGQSSAAYSRGPRREPQPARTKSHFATTPIATLVSVRGQEDNQLVGVGLVTGLAGTGDSVNMTRQLLQNLLLANNIKIDPQQLTPKNVALCRIEATLPPGVQPGRRIDVRVSALGDAKSLQGGTLTLMELTDITGQSVYATASGPVDVGGFSAGGAAATVTKNHPTVGIIAGGAKVERGVPSDIVSEHGYIYLDARAAHSTFGNLVRIAEAINQVYPRAAEASTDSRSVRVKVPGDLPSSAHVAYLDTILQREIEPSLVPRVVINERSGMIVMGEGVRLRPGAVAHGNLTITVAETPEVSQPGPLSRGNTETVDRTAVDVQEDDSGLTLIPGATTLEEVVDVLNVLGTTPRDLIAILEAMSQAGLVLAEIQRM